MKRILAPHKEQDGWVYVRVRHVGPPRVIRGRERLVIGSPGSPEKTGEYTDAVPGSRVISSRRVEEVVETADYLKRCAEEGIGVHLHTDGAVTVGVSLFADNRSFKKPKGVVRGVWASGWSLREAYHRYHNAKEA